MRWKLMICLIIPRGVCHQVVSTVRLVDPLPRIVVLICFMPRSDMVTLLKATGKSIGIKLTGELVKCDLCMLAKGSLADCRTNVEPF